jgi:single-strand DNA-binding protein
MWGGMFNLLMRENLMEHINRIELQGMVGSVRANEYNGTKVANFSIATEVLYKTRDGAVSETTWHNVVVWESKENPDVHKISKGMPVYVTGRLRTSKVTNIDGVEKTYYEVLANRVKILRDEAGEA